MTGAGTPFRQSYPAARPGLPMNMLEGAEGTMTKERFLKYVAGRYWMTLNETAQHPYKVFKDRHEVKLWLVDHGVLKSVAENCLLEADEGIASRVTVNQD
jgi:hypothetical protein